MDILRITLRWTGFTGAPGYSVFHFGTDGGFWDGGIIGDGLQQAADAAADRVASAASAAGGAIPSVVSLAVESEAEVLNSDTGEILGVVEVDAEVAQQPRMSGGYSAASGAVVNWRTNDYRFGRRIRGRTFLVPLGGDAYQSDGTLVPGALNDLNDFVAAIIGDGSGPDFGVWSRPRSGTGGVFATAVSGNVPDMAAVLRSRRD